MAWYQYNSEAMNGVPSRIRLADGSTRTALNTMSESELNAIGITTIGDPPDYDSSRKNIQWDGSSWSTPSIDDASLVAKKWEEIELHKQILAKKLNKRVDDHFMTGSGLTTSLAQVMVKLDAVNSTNYSNPFDIDLTDCQSLGITTAMVGLTTANGITNDELKIVENVFGEYKDEVINLEFETYEMQKSYFKAYIKKRWDIDCSNLTTTVTATHSLFD